MRWEGCRGYEGGREGQQAAVSQLFEKEREDAQGASRDLGRGFPGRCSQFAATARPGRVVLLKRAAHSAPSLGADATATHPSRAHFILLTIGNSRMLHIQSAIQWSEREHYSALSLRSGSLRVYSTCSKRCTIEPHRLRKSTCFGTSPSYEDTLQGKGRLASQSQNYLVPSRTPV